MLWIIALCSTIAYYGFLFGMARQVKAADTENNKDMEEASTSEIREEIPIFGATSHSSLEDFYASANKETERKKALKKQAQEETQQIEQTNTKKKAATNIPATKASEESTDLLGSILVEKTNLENQNTQEAADDEASSLRIKR